MNKRLRKLILMGGGEFAGAYDAIPNIVHVYEPARRVLASYTGNLIRLRRASDNAESDFAYNASGNLDTNAIAAWAGGASYVVTVYDQVGGDNITQAVAANQPLFTASAQNGHAGMTFDGVDDYLQGTYTVGGALSQPFHVYAVAKLDATAVNDDVIHCFIDGKDGVRMRFLTSAVSSPDTWRVNLGVYLTSPTATHSNTVLWSVLANEASSELYFNGALDVSGNIGSENAPGLTMAARYDGAQLWKGYIISVIICDPAHTTAQRQAMEAAINDYWGIY